MSGPYRPVQRGHKKKTTLNEELARVQNLDLGAEDLQTFFRDMEEVRGKENLLSTFRHRVMFTIKRFLTRGIRRMPEPNDEASCPSPIPHSVLIFPSLPLYALVSQTFHSASNTQKPGFGPGIAVLPSRHSRTKELYKGSDKLKNPIPKSSTISSPWPPGLFLGSFIDWENDEYICNARFALCQCLI